ncbi:MAG: hypothetical protein ACOZCL_17815 [Bacillota bacterium]
MKKIRALLWLLFFIIIVFAAAAVYHSVVLRSLSAAKLFEELKQSSKITICSSNGFTLVHEACADGTNKLHAYKALERLYTLDDFNYDGAVISPDGQRFFAAAKDTEKEKSLLYVFNTLTADSELYFEFEYPIRAWEWTNDGLYFEKLENDGYLYLIDSEQNIKPVWKHDKNVTIYDVWNEFVVFNTDKSFDVYNIYSGGITHLDKALLDNSKVVNIAFLNSCGDFLGTINDKGNYKVFSYVDEKLSILDNGVFEGLLHEGFMYSNETFIYDVLSSKLTEQSFYNNIQKSELSIEELFPVSIGEEYSYSGTSEYYEVLKLKNIVKEKETIIELEGIWGNGAGEEETAGKSSLAAYKKYVINSNEAVDDYLITHTDNSGKLITSKHKKLVLLKLPLQTGNAWKYKAAFDSNEYDAEASIIDINNETDTITVRTRLYGIPGYEKNPYIQYDTLQKYNGSIRTSYSTTTINDLNMFFFHKWIYQHSPSSL